MQVGNTTYHKALESLNFGPKYRNMLNLLASPDSPASRRVKINGECSNTYHIHCGVPQPRSRRSTASKHEALTPLIGSGGRRYAVCLLLTLRGCRALFAVGGLYGALERRAVIVGGGDCLGGLMKAVPRVARGGSVCCCLQRRSALRLTEKNLAIYRLEPPTHRGSGMCKARACIGMCYGYGQDCCRHNLALRPHRGPWVKKWWLFGSPCCLTMDRAGVSATVEFPWPCRSGSGARVSGRLSAPC
eukprot:scaffold6723_cov121-Isochrysis_galbana.AAC.2